MLKCRDIPSETEKLLDGELTFSERMAVRIHLFMCGNCRRYLRQLRVLLGALPGVSTPPSSDEEEIERVLLRIEQSRHDHSH